MVRQGHLVAVGTFLIGCAVLLIVGGCSGVRPEAPQEKRQGHTEATNTEQEHPPEVTASEEAARCEGTRTIKRYGGPVVTNDVPGCPEGGLLSGTDKTDTLAGLDGDDVIRGLGGKDYIWDGPGNDVLYGGDGNDFLIGIGNTLGGDGQRDKLYCGEGKDRYTANKNDYVDSSCEVKVPAGGSA